MVALLLRGVVLQSYSVPSASMVPTFQVGDRILMVKSGPLSGPIKVGDVVVFRDPRASSCASGAGQAQALVQRVIGLPGQTIWSAGDTIYVDGRILNEAGWYNPPYGQLGSTPIARIRVAQHDYYVMDDDRVDACDSRSFGQVAGSQILGRVVADVLRNGHPRVRFF